MQDNKCIHLDFHTSELIQGVGAKFDTEDFKKQLKTAGIDSITLFAKCHHGCFYYEDTAFFKHPYMVGSLLDKQVQACKEIGVSSKIYLSAGVDQHNSILHPEWLTVDKNGVRPSENGFQRLCFNTAYLEVLKAQTAEVVKKYMPYGLFFDIVADVPCYCENCMADMKKKGLNSENFDDVMRQAKDVFNLYVNEINGVVRAIKPDCLIFHNAGDFPVGRKDRLDSCDQLETESLPTSFWGYDHFPLSMSYIRRKGKNCIGMTGKFHRGWGEFGAYKYKNALKYEAAQCLAFNAGFSVGDQLHPSGEMDSYTYENIGEANAYTKERELWRGGECVAEVALYSPVGGNGRNGAARILFEEKILFDLIDEEEISNKYKFIVLSDDRELTETEYYAFRTYVKNGGRVIAMGRNILFNGKTAFDVGCEYIKEDMETPCYLRANYNLKFADKMALVAYQKAYNVKATGEVLATKISPYFTREGARFCSHLHTPYDEEKQSVGITKGSEGIYLASDLFSQYAIDGSLTAKQLISPLFDLLLEERIVITNLPSSGKVVVYKKNGNMISHLLYANTMKRGDGVEIIEDIVTLSEVNVSLKLECAPKKMVLQPSGTDLPFIYEAGRVIFTVPYFNCYEIIEIIQK